MMPARYIIVDELEKKTTELTNALDLLTQSYDDTLEALGWTLRTPKPKGTPSASVPTPFPLPRTFPFLSSI
jgi:hypothetical protein